MIKISKITKYDLTRLLASQRFRTQSKWNRNFDPDFLQFGFGVTSFFERKFFHQKIPLKRAIFLGDFLKKIINLFRIFLYSW